MHLGGLATLPFIVSIFFSCVALILLSRHKLQEILKTVFSFCLSNQRHVGEISEGKLPSEGHQGLISFPPFLPPKC